MSNLEGIQFYGDPTLEDIILHNIISFISYGLLEVGGYYSISLGQQNYLGQDESQLYPVSGQGITPYTIYKDRKNDWVWEQGIALKFSGGTQPIVPTGITINGVSTSTGYYIDYNKGQVVFNSPRSSSDIIKVPHTLRAISVYPAEENDYRFLSADWAKTSTTGVENLTYKAYLPCMSINITDFQTVRGKELGSRGKVTKCNLQFDMYATNSYELRKMTNFIYFMETKCVTFFDYKNAPKPLNYRGEIINSGSIWSNLIQNFPLGEGRFQENCIITKIINNDLPYLRARARISIEFDTYPC